MKIKLELTIHQFLDARGISRYELSKRTGIQYQTIDKYYKNRVTRYDSEILGKICGVLGCEPNDILKVTSF